MDSGEVIIIDCIGQTQDKRRIWEIREIFSIFVMNINDMETILDSIACHFEKWGALYQTAVALIFGIISIMLWYQDKKKSIQILELQRHTELLQTQLNLFIDSDKPNLKVLFFKNAMAYYRISIQNSGSDLFNLSFIPVSLESSFTISNRNHFTSLGRENAIEIEIKYLEGKKSEDFFEFNYYDRMGRHLMQKLYISVPQYTAYFYPSIII